MLYVPATEKEENDFLERILLNEKRIDIIDKESKTKGTLLHRYIKEPYADSYAIYQIIRVNKKTARIKVCYGLGDDWVLPMFGEECTVPLDYVIRNISSRDALEKLYA